MCNYNKNTLLQNGIRILFLIIGISGLSACNLFKEEAVRPHIVKIQKHVEIIRVGADEKADISSSEIKLIEAFSDLYLDKGKGSIMIGYAKSQALPLRKNIALVYSYLLKQGVDRNNIVFNTDDIGAEGKVISLLFEKYTIKQPDCYAKDFMDWKNLEKMSNRDDRFGCAYIANLAISVANPYDFVQPERLGPSDATRRSKVLSKYREKGNSGAKAEVKIKGGGK